MSETQQRFLIVIPCLNEEDYISPLVEKLIKDNKDQNFQLAIVDGGSTDKTPALAKALASKHSRVEYLHNPLKIQSAAVNLAVKTFGNACDYLIRIDAHADYPIDFCKTLVREAKKMDADSVVVAMNTVGKDGFQVAVAAAQNSKLGNGGSSHRMANGRGQWVDHGHHALMRIEAFSKIGGYDETFSHNEDAELDYRLHDAGYKVWLTGETQMTYYPRSEPVSLFKQYFKFGQGRVKNILKHKMKPRLRQLILVGIAPAVALLILTPITSLFAAPAFAWIAACFLYGTFLAYKKRDPVIALSGLAAMVMHFAWSLGFCIGLTSQKRSITNQP